VGPLGIRAVHARARRAGARRLLFRHQPHPPAGWVGAVHTARRRAAPDGRLLPPAQAALLELTRTMDVRVRFVDLAREAAEFAPAYRAALDRVLGRGWFILGAEVQAFEEEFAAWLGARACVGCASGTDALTLALRALDIGPGDEVITVANTCGPTV